MAQNKTTETEKSVTGFIDNITEDTKRTDCFELDQNNKEADKTGT